MYAIFGSGVDLYNGSYHDCEHSLRSLLLKFNWEIEADKILLFFENPS
jgi:hypothetical protein